jgi:hypothetical protein
MEWINVVRKPANDEDELCCVRSEASATTQHSESMQPKKTRGKVTGRKKRVWTKDEDDELHRLVLKYGADWGLLSTLIADRTPASLQARWEETQCSLWTAAQDRKILSLHRVHGANWRELSRQVGHSVVEVKSRYFELSSPMQLEESEKEEHLGELYEQMDLMTHYLTHLRGEMLKLEADLSELLDA